MANTQVTLLWRCKTEKGWRRFPAIFGKNGRVRTGVVQIGDEERVYPQGRFELRYYDGGRQQCFEDAGTVAAEAVERRNRLALKLAAKAAAANAGVQLEPEGAPPQRTLQAAFRDFLDDVEGRGKKEAHQVYQHAGREFLEIVRKTYPEDLTREDFTKHQKVLRERGYSARTIHNRHSNVRAFLLFCGIDMKMLYPHKPQYEKAVPEVYTREQMAGLFAAVKDPHLALIFELLLKTALREQEAVYLDWSQINWERRILSVKGNSRFGFAVKDKEQRNIPLEPGLYAHLKAYRAKHPKSRLVAGSEGDKPRIHLLRTLKQIVRDTGLACRECPTCARKSNPECERWFLHKFRATCITLWLRSREMGGAGLDLRTVQSFAGHSDLASTMRYLSPADDESARAQLSGVRWT